ncbi:MAG: SBBP repeat-containing protein [Promethearchaeota archaeon]
MKITKKLIWSCTTILAFFTLFLSISTSGAIQKSPGEDWIRTWGAENNDMAYGITTDVNGNVYIAGDYQTSSSNCIVIKYSPDGVLLWNATWGGASTDYLYDIYTDDSMNVYVTGTTRSFNISQDVILIKYNENGTLAWNRSWGGSDNDFGKGIVVDGNGNVFVAAATESFGLPARSVALLIYNSTGTLINSTIWGGSSSDNPSAISLGPNGDVFVLAETSSFGAGNADVGLIKFNSSGTLLWNTTWGSSTLDRPGDMDIHSNGDIYVSGFTYHPDLALADTSFFILKLNSSGDSQWSTIWGSWRYMDLGACIEIGADGDVYFSGITYGFGAGISDVYIAKFTGDGNQIWETLWDAGGYESIHGMVLEPATNNLYIAGEGNSFTFTHDQQMFLVKNPVLPGETLDSSHGFVIQDYVTEIVVISVGIAIIGVVAKVGLKKN